MLVLQLYRNRMQCDLLVYVVHVVDVKIIQKYMCINFGTHYQCDLDVLVNVYGTL